MSALGGKADVHAGVYVFTAAIILSLLVVQRMAALDRRALAADVG